MIPRVGPRIGQDVEYDADGRTFHAWCFDCEDSRFTDSQAEAEDWGAEHVCAEEAGGEETPYGAGGESPSYRASMRDAGRGGLLH